MNSLIGDREYNARIHSPEEPLEHRTEAAEHARQSWDARETSERSQDHAYASGKSYESVSVYGYTGTFIHNSYSIRIVLMIIRAIRYGAVSSRSTGDIPDFNFFTLPSKT
ncbi:hypothetical protein CBL_07109 [Carabus blaptoides fortunei]